MATVIAKTELAGTVYLVTGSSRGIGLEFVTQLLNRGAKVIAGARSPGSSEGLQDLLKEFSDLLFTVPLDVSIEDSIKEAAEVVAAAFPDGIDGLINNAGVFGSAAYSIPADTPGSDLSETFQTNVVGVHLTTTYFLPLLRKGKAKKIANVSALLGSTTGSFASLSGNGFFADRFIAYRVSKAALNMAGTVWANALQQEGFTVLSIHPGWVQTDMGNNGLEIMNVPGLKPDLTPEESVSGQLKVILESTVEQTGQLVNWKGEPIPW